MKRFVIISLGVILFYTLNSCQKKISFFNHVPKDYYTRHHSNEVKAQKREPVLCLKQSKEEDLAYFTKSPNVRSKEIDLDYSVSKNTFESASSQNTWNIYDVTRYSENKYPENSKAEDSKKKKQSKIFGWIAAALGIAGIFSILFGPLELVLALVFSAIGMAIASSKINPKNRIEEQKGQNDQTIASEPLTEKERNTLHVEKFGFFSTVSTVFTMMLIALAFGPYNALIIGATIPFLVLLTFGLALTSLIRFKRRPRKFRGKGYALIGMVFSSLILAAVLASIILLLTTF